MVSVAIAGLVAAWTGGFALETTAEAPAPLVPPTAEVRALWVVRTALVSPAEVDRVVDRAAEAGFNTLLVQVRGRGDAFYSSRLVSRAPLIARQPASFDPLARLLSRAKARGLAVHGWLNVLLTAHFGQPLPPGHILAEHPGWMMVPRSVAGAALRARERDLRALVGAAARNDVDVEGYYVSPASAAVGAHLTAVVRELVGNYALDGLHLDFVRYPGGDYDYSRVALESFRSTRGGKGDLLGLAAGDPVAFAAHRRTVLTSLVSRLSRAARETRPGLVVSAAVVPGETEAQVSKGQAWGDWLDRGLLDVVCPMAYAEDERAYAQQVSQIFARSSASGRSVWVGIGAWRLPIGVVVGRVRVARQAGASGIALFSHESLGESEAQRLRQEAFPVSDRAAVPGAALGTR